MTRADKLLREVVDLLREQNRLLKQLTAAQAAAAAAPVDVARPEPPPTSGAGSGVAAWVKYAREIGVEVPDKATREQVVAACRGVAT